MEGRGLGCDYINLVSSHIQADQRMFKPTLKRSKIEELLPKRTAVFDPASVSRNYVPHSVLNHRDDIFIPNNLRQEEQFIQPTHRHRLVAPLTSWGIMYPHEVSQVLCEPVKNFSTRGVGSRFGFFWLHCDKDLYIWNYDSVKAPTQPKVHRKISYNKNIRCVALGQLHQKEGKNLPPEEATYILAVGFEKVIDLFSLNLLTLELLSLQTKISVGYSNKLQYLTVSDFNEILFMNEEGSLTRASLLNPEVPQRPRTPDRFTQFTAPSPFLSYFSARNLLPVVSFQQVFVETILTHPLTNKIYVLVRRYRNQSVMHKIGENIYKTLSGKRDSNEPSDNIKKQIFVYNVGQGDRLVLEGVIENKEIELRYQNDYAVMKKQQPIKQSFFVPNKELDALQDTIVSIFIHKQVYKDSTVGYLGVLNKNGIKFVLKQSMVNKSLAFSFLFEPEIIQMDINLNREKSQNEVSLLLKEHNLTYSREEKSEELMRRLRQGKNRQIRFSFGYDNLSIMNDGTCFHLSPSAIMSLKLLAYPGNIVELSEGSRWVLFSKNKATLIKKTLVSEMLLIYAAAIDAYLKPEGASKLKTDMYIKAVETACTRISRNTEPAYLCQDVFEQLLDYYKTQTKNRFPTKSFVSLPSELVEYAKRQIETQVKASIAFGLKRNGSQYINCEWLNVSNNDGGVIKYQITEFAEKILWSGFFECWEKRDQVVDKYLYDEGQESFRRNLGYYCKNLLDTFANSLKTIQKWTPKYFLREKFTKDSIVLTLKSIMHFICQRRVKTDAAFATMVDQQLSSQKSGHRKMRDSLMVEGGTQKIMALIRSLRNEPQPLPIKSKGTLNASTKQGTQKKDKDIAEQLNNNNSMVNQTVSSISEMKPMDDEGAAPQIPPRADTPTNEIEDMLMKVIPRILSIVELFCEVSQIDIREPLPSFQSFLDSFNAQRQIKAAFLDAFKDKNIEHNKIVQKFKQQIPELRLESDIFLAKWITSINEKVLQLNSTDLKKLGENVQIAGLIKIKPMFKQIPIKYIQMLLCRKYSNTFHLNLIKMAEDQDQQKQKQAINQLEFLNECKSIFYAEGLKYQQKIYCDYQEENSKINEEIISYLKEFIRQFSRSKQEDYIELEEKLKEILLFLSQLEDRSYVDEIVRYLMDTRIMPECAYELKNTLRLQQYRRKGGKASMFIQKKQAEMMNTAEIFHMKQRSIAEILPAVHPVVPPRRTDGL